MAGQNHLVKCFGASVGEHAHALGHALNAPHRGAQALVVDALGDACHILPRTAAHGVPAGAVVDLDQAVVVAKADQGGHRKAQHLIGRAAPNAAQHGQQIPVAKHRAKLVRGQKIFQGLLQLGIFALLGQAAGQGVEAQHIAQHGPKARAQQVAALGKHGVEGGPVPFQAGRPIGARHLHRKRHVRRRAGHAQIGQQGDQPRVGALVEHQKPGVHAVGGRLAAAGQGHVHGVGVAAKVVSRLKQADLGMAMQAVGRTQAGNARTNNGNFHSVFKKKGQSGTWARSVCILAKSVRAA